MKQFTLESKALTAFRGSPVRMRAGVALPESHGREPGRTYPVVYEVPGFGGNHFSAIGRQNQGLTKVAGLLSSLSELLLVEQKFELARLWAETI